MTSTEDRAAHSLHCEEVEADRVEDALGVLDTAGRWLADCGIEQWPLSFTESPERARKIAEEAERGNLFVWYVLNRPAGTCIISDWQDPDFAKGWPDGEVTAQYVMRLATARWASDLVPGLGVRMLDYATTLAGIRGASVLRLDCARRNKKLHEYYYRNGFDQVGAVAVPGRKSGALFQKAV